MNDNKLFLKTRFKLAIWYVFIMGLILSFCGFGVYETIVYIHWQSIQKELISVGGTIHDNLENDLKQSQNFQLNAKELLPQPKEEGHYLGVISQGKYYIKLLNPAGKVVSWAGFKPQDLPYTSPETTQKILKDAKGNRFYQISIHLHTPANTTWGYMQMGRSLEDLDKEIKIMQFVLILGFPIAIILVGFSSWWLAGLAMQPIYQSYRQIEQFTADAAHELRTPLATTQAIVQTALRRLPISEIQSQDILQTLERQNQRLIQLVTDLLLLTRLDRQVLSKQMQRCSLNDIINDLIEELSIVAFNSQIQLKYYVKVSGPVQVWGDEDQLYRLFMNLIINAIKYTPVNGQVKVILERSSYHAIVAIEDSGIGIAPEEQKRIFERFYRINSDRSRETGGSGLGLAIAMAITRTHNGSLTVQSSLGKGSTFIVNLPI
jgi:signal transduction histidine kinase